MKPQQHSRRKVPIESKEAIEKEIDYMLEEGIVVEQIEPTPWVSSATFPKKANGDTRVCLDPKDLNKAIIRENHKPMTVEEIAHQLAGAVVYTKADALKAFLQVHLTYEASLLTTFNYHRGRLRFLHIPFGAKMSQDIFQLCMDAILEQCPGVIGIHNDIVIFGTSNEDHDANLINLMNVCQKEGLVLNSKKLKLRKERVTFFGAEYSTAGMHPDPKKIQGIIEMTALEDKQQLQSFLGMVNYMGTFIPNLSHHTEPLRSMLKQDNVFTWDEVKTRSFQQIKSLILKANETPLRYYDRLKPVTVQADASLRGLGTCLVQDNQPIAFASKSLTEEPSSSGTPDTSNSNENSILSATSSPPKREQSVNCTGTSNSVLSGPSSMNISKPTLTSKASVSDTATRSKGIKHTRFNEDPVSSIQAIPACTVKTKRPSTKNRRSSIATFDVTDPDLLIPLQQAVTGIPDQRNAQPTVPPLPSASLSANPQPSSRETTTKEPLVVLPVSQTAGQETESESSSSSSSESFSESSSSSGSSSEALSTTTSPSTSTTSVSSSTSTSPEMLELERSICTIISHEHHRLGHAVNRNNLDGAKQRILVMQQVIQQQRPRPVSTPPAASQPLLPYPGRHLSDTGSMSKVQAGNAIPRTSTPETNDRLQDIQDQPRRRIGPSRVKELAKYFTLTSDEDDNSCVNTRTRRKKLFPPR